MNAVPAVNWDFIFINSGNQYLMGFYLCLFVKIVVRVIFSYEDIDY